MNLPIYLCYDKAMDNIVWLYGKPQKKPPKTSAKRALNEASQIADGLESVLVIAYRKSGELVYLTNERSTAELVCMLEHLKLNLLEPDE